MDDTQKEVIKWLASGSVGVSSKCMAMWLAFGELPPVGDRSTPRDPDDLDRCLRLLEAAPGLRERLPNMAKVSREWKAMVSQWDEMEESHINEVGLGWTKGRSAPRTYRLMQEALAAA